MPTLRRTSLTKLRPSSATIMSTHSIVSSVPLYLSSQAPLIGMLSIGRFKSTASISSVLKLPGQVFGRATMSSHMGPSTVRIAVWSASATMKVFMATTRSITSARKSSMVMPSIMASCMPACTVFMSRQGLSVVTPGSAGGGAETSRPYLTGPSMLATWRVRQVLRRSKSVAAKKLLITALLATLSTKLPTSAGWPTSALIAGLRPTRWYTVMSLLGSSTMSPAMSPSAPPIAVLSASVRSGWVAACSS